MYLNTLNEALSKMINKYSLNEGDIIYRGEPRKIQPNDIAELQDAFYHVIRLLKKYDIDTKQTIDASNAAYSDILRQAYGELNYK